MKNLFNHNTQKDIRIDYKENAILRIPFQGSKNALVKKIYNVINQDLQNNTFNKKVNKFYDLFCGGGSVGYYFYQQGFQVVMNDINTDLIALHKQLQIGIDKDLLYKWISREEFKEIIKQDGWYSLLKYMGLCKIILDFYNRFITKIVKCLNI